MNTEQLGEILERAAAPVPRPDLARAALDRATAVRRTRTGASATLAAAAAVAVVAVGVSLGGDAFPDGPVAPPSSPTTEDAPSARATPPAIGGSVVQPRWDPREVTQLPSVDIGLPASLEPPGSAEPLTGIEAALALVDDQQRLFIVDASGSWASLDYPEDPLDRYGSPAVLTVDGSRVVFSGGTALWSREVSGGEWLRFDYPADFTREADWGGAQLLPDDADGLWLGDPRTRDTWYVGLTDGSVTERDVDLDIATWAGERGLVRIGVESGQRYLAVGTPGEDETLWDTDYLESLTDPASDGESLAAARGVGGWYGGSRGPTEQNGLIALRLDDLATRAYLTITDPNYWYTDAQALAALSWLDADTVLASVVPQDTGGYDTGARYLFTWNVTTGELRLVSGMPARMALSVAREGLGYPPR